MNMKSGWALSLAATLSAWTVVAAQSPEDAVFYPGTLPVDIKGYPVHAHGGGVLLSAGLYYWYGTSQKLANDWISEGITLYSSPDLMTWTFEGEIFSGTSIEGMPYPPPYRIERPKIIRNDRTGHWVMMFHLDTPSFAYPAVGVCRAEQLTGPWEWVRVFKPDRRNSYDMTLFADDDGQAYLINSVENSFLGISRLSDDYMDTTGLCSHATQAEGPAVFKSDGYYYIYASHLTGWSPNPPHLFRRPKMCGESWIELPAPAMGPGSDSTFNSQSTFVFPFRFADGSFVNIYMGDRWNSGGPGDVGNASYVWLPLLSKGPGRGFTMRYYDSWKLSDFKPAPMTPFSPAAEEEQLVPGGGAEAWQAEQVVQPLASSISSEA